MTQAPLPLMKPSIFAGQRGLALVVVLWAAVLLALIAGAVTRLSRADLNLARNLAEGTQAELAADSALWTAIYRIVNDGPEAWPADGQIYAWQFGDSEVRVRVTDEFGRIDINAAPPELLAALFAAAGTMPEEATRLADAVVEYRDLRIKRSDDSDTSEDSAADQRRRPDVPFALIDGLAQVPGITIELLRQVAHAITVYTGEAGPRSEALTPLVLAAIEGRVLGGEPEDAAGDESEVVLSENPSLLGEPAEPMQVFSGLLHIEAEAVSAGGAHFAREAVVALERRKALSYHLRLWRRGDRILFPVPSETLTASDPGQ